MVKPVALFVAEAYSEILAMCALKVLEDPTDHVDFVMGNRGSVE